MTSCLLFLLALTQIGINGATTAPTVQFPQETIASSGIQATLYLPDAQSGYYRGTRFDWSGAIGSLQWKGHEYFGPWFERHDPTIHDAITGPVEEFLTRDAGLGYDEVKAGEAFVRIGVGAVRKPDEPSYRRFATYEIVDPGKRTVNRGPDWIEFVHELRDTGGYSYIYRKRVQLGKDTLVLEHHLRNTGGKPIVSTVYDHNFFTLDRQPTGPDVVVRFAFEPRAPGPLNGLGEARGNEVRFLTPIVKPKTMFTEVEGFSRTQKDYDIRVENQKTGAGVHVTADRPLARLVFWAHPATVCPEPYIDIDVKPGEEFSWRLTYQFYEAKTGAGSKKARGTR